MIRPRLITGSRLTYDRVRAEHVLLVPEGIVRLNPTAAGVLELCDGSRSLDEIIRVLTTRYAASDLHDDVRGFIHALADKGIVIDGGE